MGNCVVINSSFFLVIISMDTTATENGVGFCSNLCSHHYMTSENGPFSIFPHFGIQEKIGPKF